MPLSLFGCLAQWFAQAEMGDPVHPHNHENFIPCEEITNPVRWKQERKNVVQHSYQLLVAYSYPYYELPFLNRLLNCMKALRYLRDKKGWGGSLFRRVAWSEIWRFHYCYL